MTREIDAAVAEAMGYYVGPVNWDVKWLYAIDEETYHRYVDYGKTGYDTMNGRAVFCLPLPHFWTRVADSWEVVEWMNRHDPPYHLKLAQHIDEWEAWFCVPINFPSFNRDQYAYFAPTASEAICLAFLKAMGREVPDA